MLEFIRVNARLVKKKWTPIISWWWKGVKYRYLVSQMSTIEEQKYFIEYVDRYKRFPKKTRRFRAPTGNTYDWKAASERSKRILSRRD